MKCLAYLKDPVFIINAFGSVCVHSFIPFIHFKIHFRIYKRVFVNHFGQEVNFFFHMPPSTRSALKYNTHGHTEQKNKSEVWVRRAVVPSLSYSQLIYMNEYPLICKHTHTHTEYSFLFTFLCALLYAHTAVFRFFFTFFLCHARPGAMCYRRQYIVNTHLKEAEKIGIDVGVNDMRNQRRE